MERSNKTGHSWHKDDEIIALNAYFQVYKIIELNACFQGKAKEKDAINKAVELVNHRTERDNEPLFNNEKSMIMKLANIMFLDESNPNKGLSHPSKKNKEVWDQYSKNRDALDKKISEICKSFIKN